MISEFLPCFPHPPCSAHSLGPSQPALETLDGSKAQRWPNPITDMVLVGPFLTSPRSVPRPFPGGFFAAFHAGLLMQSYFNAALCILLLPRSLPHKVKAAELDRLECCARMGWMCSACLWRLGFMGHHWEVGGERGRAPEPRGEAPRGLSWEQAGIATTRGLRAVNGHREHQPAFEISSSCSTAQMCPDVFGDLFPCLAGVTGELGLDFTLAHLPRGGW